MTLRLQTGSARGRALREQSRSSRLSAQSLPELDVTRRRSSTPLPLVVRRDSEARLSASAQYESAGPRLRLGSG